MHTICVFGDSITWGRGLSTRVAWTNLLRNYLEDLDASIHLYDLGIDGDTTAGLLQRCEGEAKARRPNIIVWAIGVNDSAYRREESNPVVSLQDFESNMRRLIDIGHAIHAKQLVIGLSKGSDAATAPLAESTTGKCYTKARTEQYDSQLRRVAESKGIHYVAVADVLDDSDFYDGLHPNEIGHMRMFLKIQPAVSTLL